jgi:hypothetical protein
MIKPWLVYKVYISRVLMSIFHFVLCISVVAERNTRDVHVLLKCFHAVCTTFPDSGVYVRGGFCDAS